MTDTIQKVLDVYLVCKSHTGPNHRLKHNFPAPIKPFHIVSIDIIRSLPVAVGGHQYILIAVDYLTKWLNRLLTLLPPPNSRPHSSPSMALFAW